MSYQGCSTQRFSINSIESGLCSDHSSSGNDSDAFLSDFGMNFIIDKLFVLYSTKTYRSVYARLSLFVGMVTFMLVLH